MPVSFRTAVFVLAVLLAGMPRPARGMWPIDRMARARGDTLTSAEWQERFQTWRGRALGGTESSQAAADDIEALRKAAESGISIRRCWRASPSKHSPERSICRQRRAPPGPPRIPQERHRPALRAPPLPAPALGVTPSGPGTCCWMDFPGTGKTTLAKALAAAVEADFKRVQFTPDLLPSDILDVSVFNPKDQSFVFHEGPIFTQICLADEINRATPKTQSALLETMQEGTVTISGVRYELQKPFFVMATQNPIEQEGTYPLPEAQARSFLLQAGGRLFVA